jgi:hypothetical protein
MMPGVVFLATQLWRHLVPFNICFAVGLLVFIMVGKFVIHGIVMFGVASITLCSSSRVANRVLFATLFPCWEVWGVKDYQSSGQKISINAFFWWCYLLVP